jgi:MoxR-like ATPase
MKLPGSVADTAALLAAGGYIADTALATTVHLALVMQRPLFLEGEPGTGKTEIAKVLAAGLGRRLVRLQCYDGLDLNAAAYEWDHARQLMAIRLAEAAGDADRAAISSEIYGRAFLQPRPLLSAIDPDQPPAVLLIDELDRADEPFEAFLLEILADFQVTIPEYGTIRATTPPVVVLTSNRTREVHDAIRRRCITGWIIPMRGGSGRSSRARPQRCPRCWPPRSWRSCSGCAGRICSSCRAWPRRSTGRRPCRIWTSTNSPPKRWTRRWACC